MSDFWREIGKGRLFSHPIHAMLVHFPTAFLPAGFLFNLLGVYLSDATLSLLAVYLFGLGVITGIAAAVFGFLDYTHIAAQSEAWSKASWHGLTNFLLLVCFGVIVGFEIKQLPGIQPASNGELVFQGCLVIALFYANYLGGELLFKHRIGLDEE